MFLGVLSYLFAVASATFDYPGKPTEQDVKDFFSSNVAVVLHQRSYSLEVSGKDRTCIYFKNISPSPAAIQLLPVYKVGGKLVNYRVDITLARGALADDAPVMTAVPSGDIWTQLGNSILAEEFCLVQFPGDRCCCSQLNLREGERQISQVCLERLRCIIRNLHGPLTKFIAASTSMWLTSYVKVDQVTAGLLAKEARSYPPSFAVPPENNIAIELLVHHLKNLNRRCTALVSHEDFNATGLAGNPTMTRKYRFQYYDKEEKCAVITFTEPEGSTKCEILVWARKATTGPSWNCRREYSYLCPHGRAYEVHSDECSYQ